MDTPVDSAAGSSSSPLPVMPSWNSELASPVTLGLTHVTGEAEMTLTTAARVRGAPLPSPCSYSSDLPGMATSESPESTEVSLACEDLCSKRLKVDYTCHIICYAIRASSRKKEHRLYLTWKDNGATFFFFFLEKSMLILLVCFSLGHFLKTLSTAHTWAYYIFNHLSKDFDMTG